MEKCVEINKEFEQLIARGKELIEKSCMKWQEPEEILRAMREKHEKNLMESLGYEI